MLGKQTVMFDAADRDSLDGESSPLTPVSVSVSVSCLNSSSVIVAVIIMILLLSLVFLSAAAAAALLLTLVIILVCTTYYLLSTFCEDEGDFAQNNFPPG